MSNEDGEDTIKVAILSTRVTNLEKLHTETSNAVKSIDQSLKTLVSLEVKHEVTSQGLSRAFTAISDHETRLRNIETRMPSMKMVHNWVVTGVIGGISILGLMVINHVLQK